MLHYSYTITFGSLFASIIECMQSVEKSIHFIKKLRYWDRKKFLTLRSCVSTFNNNISTRRNQSYRISICIKFDYNWLQWRIFITDVNKGDCSPPRVYTIHALYSRTAKNRFYSASVEGEKNTQHQQQQRRATSFYVYDLIFIGTVHTRGPRTIKFARLNRRPPSDLETSFPLCVCIEWSMHTRRHTHTYYTYGPGMQRHLPIPKYYLKIRSISRRRESRALSLSCSSALPRSLTTTTTTTTTQQSRESERERERERGREQQLSWSWQIVHSRSLGSERACTYIIVFSLARSFWLFHGRSIFMQMCKRFFVFLFLFYIRTHTRAQASLRRLFPSPAACALVCVYALADTSTRLRTVGCPAGGCIHFTYILWSSACRREKDSESCWADCLI